MSNEENLFPEHLKDPLINPLPRRKKRKKKGWFGRLKSRLSISKRKQEARKEKHQIPEHLKAPLINPLPRRKKRKKKGWFGRLKSRLSMSKRKQEARKEKRQKRKALKKSFKRRKKESRNRKKLARIRKDKSGFWGLRKSKTPMFRSQKNSVGVFFNSFIIFILTYLITYFIYQIVVIFFAAHYQIDGTLYCYDLTFNDVSVLWKRFNIILITGSGPLVCLLLGIFLYRRPASSEKISGYQKMFFLWLSLHLINHFLGAFVAGIITSDGFGYSVNWLYMEIGWKFFFALSFLLGMMLIGYRSAGKFLEAVNYRQRVTKENTMHLLLYTILFPLLFGTITLLLLRMPMNFTFPYETIVMFTFIIGMTPAIFNRKSIKKRTVKSKPGLWNIRYEHLFLLLLLLVFYRTILFEGLNIVMRYNFSFSVGFA